MANIRLAIALAVMLAFGSPRMLARPVVVSAQPLGTPFKTVHTVDGDVTVYHVAAGCAVAFRGVVLQVVSERTCRA